MKTGTCWLGYVPENAKTGTCWLGCVPKNSKTSTCWLGCVPKNGIGLHIVQLIRLTVSIVPYCQAVKKFVKPQSVHSLRIGLNALGGVCLIFSHSLLYIGVA